MVRGRTIIKVAASGVLLVVVGGASARAEAQTTRRPVSLISSRLLMVQGRPAVPVADLATALGGAAQLDERALSYRIRPGAVALLRFDELGRGMTSRPRPQGAKRDGPGGVSEPGLPGSPSLFIGSVLATERLVVLGRDAYVYLDDLAALFGGSARLDPSLGQWFIVDARPGMLLSFR